MQLKQLNPRKSLNKAFLKLKPNRLQIDKFKNNFKQLISQINENESEEFHKNVVSDFLKSTYYSPEHYINTKDRKDGLVDGLVENQRKIIALIKDNPKISKRELSKFLGISTTAIDKNIRTLKNKNLIQRVGPDKGGCWKFIRKK